MSYAPLDSDLLTSTILKEGPDVLAVWVLMLASMNKLCESSMQPAAAASLLRISDERAERAFSVLAAPDPKSRNKNHDGRRMLPRENGCWFIVSGDKYQWLSSRSAATERQRRYELRKKEQEKLNSGLLPKCAWNGCERPSNGELAGRQVCTQHAFPAEPGEDGQP